MIDNTRAGKCKTVQDVGWVSEGERWLRKETSKRNSRLHVLHFILKLAGRSIVLNCFKSRYTLHVLLDDLCENNFCLEKMSKVFF